MDIMFVRFNKMEGMLSQINNYLSKYIDLAAVGKFLAEHKGTVLATSSIVLYVAWFLKRPRNLPPGPYGYPVIGSIPVMMGDMSANFSQMAKKYGDVFCLWLGSDYYLVVLNSYDAVKEAYISRGADFADRGKMKLIVSEDTIIDSPYNDRYKSSRKIANQAIRSMISTRLDTLFQAEMTKAVEYIDQQSDLDSTDLSAPITHVFGNIICGLVFNKTYAHGDKTLVNLADDISRWLGKILTVLSLEILPRYLQVFAKKQITDAQEETDHLLGIIKGHIADHKLDKSYTNEITDVVDAYLKAEEKGMFPPETIAGTVLNFLPDGIDTASLMGQWLFVYLLNYPQYQEEIYKEIEDLRGDSPVCISDRANMPKTEAFIMEVLRVVTPVSTGFINMPSKSTTFRGYNMPKFVHIIPHIRAFHNDPKYFPEPEQFKPERFIKDGKIHNIEALMPFGTGRRMCIGQPLVRNELFLLLTSMVQKYHMTQGCTGLPSLQKVKQELIVEALKPPRFTVKLEKRM